MALIPDIGCEDPEIPESCNALFDMGEALLVAGMDALEPFATDEGCGCEFTGYVSLGPPTPGRCDVLAVSLDNYVAVGQGQPNANWFAFRATWTIRLWEGCYPLDPGADQPAGIDLAKLHEWHRHSYAHGLALHQAILGARKQPPFGECSTFEVTALTPLAPSGLCAGWAMSATADVPPSP